MNDYPQILFTFMMYINMHQEQRAVQYEIKSY